MILLDTNVLVRFVKGDAAIANWLKSIPRNELGIPAIVLYELEYRSLKAAFPARRRNLLHRALEHIEQVPFDSPAASKPQESAFSSNSRAASSGPWIC